MSFDTSLWKRLQEEKKLARESYRLQRLEEVRSLLADYFASQDVEKVYLTGSIIREHFFAEYSDIDIAVLGLNPKEYFRVFGDLEELLDTENIDLIEMERCSFRDFIEIYGLRIL